MSPSNLLFPLHRIWLRFAAKTPRLRSEPGFRSETVSLQDCSRKDS